MREWEQLVSAYCRMHSMRANRRLHAIFFGGSWLLIALTLVNRHLAYLLGLPVLYALARLGHHIEGSPPATPLIVAETGWSDWRRVLRVHAADAWCLSLMVLEQLGLFTWPVQRAVPVRPATPQLTFDAVARRYDLVNACLSLGLDRRWRRRAAGALPVGPDMRVLDVATGTGALALAVAAMVPGARIVGCDRNAAMLRVGRDRIQRRGAAIPLVRSRAEALAFRDASVDAVTLAFAIDDMESRSRCAEEICRVLRPGGSVVILELSLPQAGWFNALYRVYLGAFPVVGRLVSGTDGCAHLRQEIVAYRGRDATAALLRASGFTDYRTMPLSGGLVSLHVARRPDDATARSHAHPGSTTT